MNINHLNLNLVRVFAAIYEHGTLTRAADQLGLSQPGVSHALKQLRETFNDELFVRGIDGYRPTARALELAPAFLDALKMLQAAVADTGQFDPARARTEFRIGASDYSSQTLLPGLIQHLAEHAPGVRCAVAQLSYDTFQEELKDGRLDLAIVARLPADSESDQQLILQDMPCCISRRGNPVTADGLDLNTFTSAEHVIVNLYGNLRSWLDDELDERGLQRTVKFVVPYFNSVLEVVATTNMIGTVPTRVAVEALNTHNLDLFPLPLEFPPIEFVIAWHPRRERDPELLWLRGVIASLCTPG